MIKPTEYDLRPRQVDPSHPSFQENLEHLRSIQGFTEPHSGPIELYKFVHRVLIEYVFADTAYFVRLHRDFRDGDDYALGVFGFREAPPKHLEAVFGAGDVSIYNLYNAVRLHRINTIEWVLNYQPPIRHDGTPFGPDFIALMTKYFFYALREKFRQFGDLLPPFFETYFRRYSDRWASAYNTRNDDERRQRLRMIFPEFVVDQGLNFDPNDPEAYRTEHDAQIKRYGLPADTNSWSTDDNYHYIEIVTSGKFANEPPPWYGDGNIDDDGIEDLCNLGAYLWQRDTTVISYRLAQRKIVENEYDPTFPPGQWP